MDDGSWANSDPHLRLTYLRVIENHPAYRVYVRKVTTDAFYQKVLRDLKTYLHERGYTTYNIAPGDVVHTGLVPLHPRRDSSV